MHPADAIVNLTAATDNVLIWWRRCSSSGAYRYDAATAGEWNLKAIKIFQFSSRRLGFFRRLSHFHVQRW